MEYLVTMTAHVPDSTPEGTVEDIRTREAARSRDLAAHGHLRRPWRPPLQPGEWRTLGERAGSVIPAAARLARQTRSRQSRTSGIH